ncbi:hypothetical protein ABIE66_000649 [Peribacillus sp. B2I2]
MKEKYIDEIYSYISENKNISTKSTVISTIEMKKD